MKSRDQLLSTAIWLLNSIDIQIEEGLRVEELAGKRLRMPAKDEFLKILVSGRDIEHIKGFIKDYEAMKKREESAPTTQSPLSWPLAAQNPLCSCRKCNPNANWFIVCEFCGNKRCPHATDHELECTKSNEPGQKGSVFQ